MKIIGLDSSGLVASVALWEDGCILAEYSTNYKKTHSQTLLPMLDEVRSMLGVTLETVDAIAIACGPGSFTGLRIGSATAKGLGMAWNVPIVEVPTLEGLAWQLWGTDKIVCPMMDAKRQQVYAGVYEFFEVGTTYEMCPVEEQQAIAVEDLMERLNTLGREVILTGDGVPVYMEELQKLEVPFQVAPSFMNRQRAAAVADLGAVYFAAGKAIPADDHAPEYLRKSQAEREGPQKFEI